MAMIRQLSTWAMFALLGAGVAATALTAHPEPAMAQAKAKKVGAKPGAHDSALIPIGASPTLGVASAPVTVVIFGDFQCPFCQRGAKTVKDLYDQHPDQVRLVFKHFPLAFHAQAKQASWAALAAQRQGAFWPMHDKLYDRFQEFKGAQMDALMEQLAIEAGLELERFKTDYADPTLRAQVEDDIKLGESLGVRGTPHFFLNGERISGAQSYERFKQVLDGQLEQAKLARAKGVKPAALYDHLVRQSYKTAEASKPSAPTGPQAPAAAVQVPVTKEDPIRGDLKTPEVTLVVFSEFQCPFCSRAEASLKATLERYPQGVRVVFKHYPLPFHKEADEAARAAIAAHKQGKFWELHDVLFEQQREMSKYKDDPDSLMVGLAQQVSLEPKRFQKDYSAKATMSKLAQDMELGQRLGVRGTPTIFINGVRVVGAQPVEQLAQTIDAQLALAQTLKAKDKKLKGESLYKALMDHNIKQAPSAEAAAAPAADAPDGKRAQDALKLLAVKHSPVEGPANAPITIYEFTDLQCPFCARASVTVDGLLAKYPGKVRLVTKNFPLPFHKEAEPAARALLAAHKQGKAHAMRAKIFEQYQQLSKDPELLIKLANELGLDVVRFERDMASDAISQQVKDDIKMGEQLGVRGTPNFFINGVPLTGAQPADRFEAIIEEQLKATP